MPNHMTDEFLVDDVPVTLVLPPAQARTLYDVLYAALDSVLVPDETPDLFDEVGRQFQEQKFDVEK